MPPRFSLNTDLTLGVNAPLVTCVLSPKYAVEKYPSSFKFNCKQYFEWIGIYWIYANEVSFTRSQNYFEVGNTGYVCMKWDTPYPKCLTKAKAKWKRNKDEWSGMHPIWNVWSKGEHSERRTRVQSQYHWWKAPSLKREENEKSSWVGDSYFILVLLCFWKNASLKKPQRNDAQIHLNGFIAYSSGPSFYVVGEVPV